MAEQIIVYANNGVVTNAVNMPSMSQEVLSKIQPFLELSEKLGNFMGQICKSGVKEMIVEYSGIVSEMNVAPLTVSVQTCSSAEFLLLIQVKLAENPTPV